MNEANKAPKTSARTPLADITNQPKGPAPTKDAKLYNVNVGGSPPKKRADNALISPLTSHDNHTIAEFLEKRTVEQAPKTNLLDKDDAQKGQKQTDSLDKKENLAAGLSVNKPEEVKTTNSSKYRLLVGEADLAFALAFVKKHPELAPFMVATTYEAEADLKDLYPDTFETNKKALMERNVKVLHQVDATKLRTDERFKNQKFGHIHFNFPHDAEDYKKTQTPQIIQGFLTSARKVLTKQGHIHMALVSKGKLKGGQDNLEFYHGCIYKIADATINGNYKLHKKRKFDGKRYPGYHHKITTRDGSVQAAESNGREYIFEKISSDEENAIKANKGTFRTIYRQKDKKYLPNIATDPESSDYEDYKANELLHTPTEKGLEEALSHIDLNKDTKSEEKGSNMTSTSEEKEKPVGY